MGFWKIWYLALCLFDVLLAAMNAVSGDMLLALACVIVSASFFYAFLKEEE